MKIKLKPYISKIKGSGYNSTEAELDILGDGEGGGVVVDVTGGKITDVTVSSGGKNYSYGRIDLSTINSGSTGFANLIPIIPPSRGHGYNIYEELGTDRVLVYARFDDSTKDFPLDTRFAQIGIIKNPTQIGSASTIFSENKFSNLKGLKLTSVATPEDAIPGNQIFQTVTGIGTATGYIAAYDDETQVLKYFQDRSLYFNSGSYDQKDAKTVNSDALKIDFRAAGGGTITSSNSFSGTIDGSFTGITTQVTSSKNVNLDVQFTNGVSAPEINKGSGQIIYLDNRPRVSRNPRQKEDIKIVLNSKKDDTKN